MVEAEIVLDSVNIETGDRITTVRCVLPRIVLAELVTHRLLFIDQTEDLATLYGAYDADIPHSLSKNAASSRAVPITRMLERVRNYPFVPVFRSANKGMKSGEPVDDVTQAKALEIWAHTMKACMDGATALAELGIEKGIANRLLEWFSHVEVLLTATEWNNFFLLRDHEDAQIEICDLARCIRRVMDKSEPQTLRSGEWHLPYLPGCPVNYEHWAEVSAARCARVSYRSLATGKPSTITEDCDLFDKLTAGNPKHLSPLEHPAMAIGQHDRHGNLVGFKSLRKFMFEGVESGGDLK